MKVNIDGLTVLVVPKSSVVYDAEKEKREQIDAKLFQVKKLLDLEKEKAAQTTQVDQSAQQDTFSERLQLQLIRNIELHISNLHVRYEDDFSKPDHPFSTGFTLNAIEIKVFFASDFVKTPFLPNNIHV